MNRAYGRIDLKSIDEEARVITGVASSVATDRMGDIVRPKGAKFKLPLPLLYQHDHRKPVGHVEFAQAGDDTITFRAKFAKIAEAGAVKDRVDEAWQDVKAGLVRGVSIGFRPIEHEWLEDGDGIDFKSWEWLELSVVTIPANQDATIQTIRSIDSELLAATGTRQSASSKPGVTGSTRPKPKERAMTIAEQIAAFEAKRAAKAARMEELMNKAAGEGSTLDAGESEEYDTTKTEIDEIDKHLVRLHDLEAINKAKAVSVAGVKDGATASQARGGMPIISVKPNVPKGTTFTRYAIALGVSKGNKMEAMEVARQRWGDQSGEIVDVLKAAIAAGTTTDSTWASPLIAYNVMASEFIDLLRPATIVGRIPGLRRVPFNIQMPRQTAGSSFQWVGEGVPKPLSKLAFDTMTLRWAKAAGIVVFTEELLRFSNPSAEELVRNDLVAACAQFLDQQFLDPDKAEVTNISPAGITAGITPIQASGTTAAALRLDIMHLMAPFIAANLSLQTAVWIMSPTLALAISLMQNPLGQPEFSGFNLTNAGGTFMGIPVVLSENMSTGMIVLIVANEILLADDGGVNIDVSREASLQMDSAPTNPPTASTVFVSLWQQNMVGLRAERFINWKRRRDAAVGYIANSGYGGAPGGSGT
jgi:HK97 family phage major capsid protein/HK97 family phage prohead protease